MSAISIIKTRKKAMAPLGKKESCSSCAGCCSSMVLDLTSKKAFSTKGNDDKSHSTTATFRL